MRMSPGIKVVLLFGLLLITFIALLPVGMWLTDPLTQSPIGQSREPFPVLQVGAGVAEVMMVEDLKAMVPPRAGFSYLVPRGDGARIEQYLAEHEKERRDGGWVIKVKELGPDRQAIELYWMADGYWGSGYEATATSVRPLYRKITGPGFALYFGGAAAVLDLILWSIVISVVWKVRQARRVAV